MVKVHPLADREHLGTLTRMREKHYDRRSIVIHVTDIEEILAEIDRTNGRTGKVEAWGPYRDARTSPPTTYGYRVRWVIEGGTPVVLAIVSGRRRPGFGSRRKPI